MNRATAEAGGSTPSQPSPAARERASVLPLPRSGRGAGWGFLGHRILPVVTVLLILFAIWFAAAILLNGPRAGEALARANPDYSTTDLVRAAWTMDRPVLPTPWQIARDLWQNTAERAVTSNRSLLYHAWFTLSSTALGFLMGTALGIALAVGMLYVRTLERSLMPWVIASQAIPILAIAPMIVVVLNRADLTGLFPKSVISAYLSFYPVTIGVLKGLRSPDPLQLDLLRTYSATPLQVFAKLRWPASIDFLVPSLKVGVTLALIGAVVGEVSTSEVGIGARLLSGSYFGQMIQVWSALIMSGLLAILLIALVTVAERAIVASRGGRP